MTWKGYENYTPFSEASTAPPRAPQGRRPRVKGYVRTWVNERVGVLLDRPPSETEAAQCRLFDSKKEAQRYLALREAEKLGVIFQLQCQVRFPLNVTRPDGQVETIAHWTADFMYRNRDSAGGQVVLEEVKGFKTEIYKRSKKHFECQYGVRILET